MIGTANSKKVHLIRGFGWLLKLMGLFVNKVNKAFGNLSYELGMSEYKAEYRKFSLEESIKETEK